MATRQKSLISKHGKAAGNQQKSNKASLALQA